MKFADKIKIVPAQIYNVIRMGDNQMAKLNEPSIMIQSVSPKMRNFIDSLKMTAAKEGVVSLSAKQLGIQQSFFVIKKQFTRNKWFYQNCSPSDYNVYVNPQIMAESLLTQAEWEECPTFPYLMAKVIRPDSVEVQFRDENFETRELTLDDFYGRVFQHEVDHLKGKLIENEHRQLRESHRTQNEVIDINMSGYEKNTDIMDSFTRSLESKLGK